MKLAYVTLDDPSDIRTWSGTNYYIHKALTETGFSMVGIGNLQRKPVLITRAKQFFYKCIRSQTYLRLRDPLFAMNYARQIEHTLVHADVDAILSLETYPISFLQTQNPIILWRDATFAGMVGFHPFYRNLCKESIRDGHRTERLAFEKCRLALFSSEWAASSAIKDYGTDPSKIKVVPFGANIECNRNLAQIRNIISQKSSKVCKLLFIGVVWYWKGGDVAVQVAERLNQMGLPTELHIAGCTPPYPLPDFVKSYGFISKKTEQGRAQLNDLFEKSHFFILPTRADCYGIVFAEASSFGLPSLAPDIGGISTVVRNGRNGHTFSRGDDPQLYCQTVLDMMANRQEYERLSLSAFNEYTERLNWYTAGKRVRDLINEFSR